MARSLRARGGSCEEEKLSYSRNDVQRLGGKIKQRALSYSGVWRCCCSRLLRGVSFRPFITHSTERIMGTRREPQRDGTWAAVSSVNLRFELVFYCLLILYSIKMGKESFLALLRHSEHSLRVKGENRVLSLTLPSFSFIQCSPSNCWKATGDRGALPYLIPPGEGSRGRGVVGKRV